MIGAAAGSVISIFLAFWWVIVPFFLFIVFRNLWLKYVRAEYLKSISWTTLEVKVPRSVLKTPKAMEIIFSELHAVYSGDPNFIEKYWRGKVENWLSFEIVGHAGGVYFFTRVPSLFRNLAEAAIYSQYPDAEISEIDDYTDLLPSVLPNQTYDVWGADFILARESAYPIRTYIFYEAPVEEQRLDPMAAMTEVMSKLKPDETIWIQVLVRPAGDGWKKQAEELVNQLIGKKTAAGGKWHDFSWLFDLFRNFVRAFFEPPVWGEKEKAAAPAPASLTPGQQTAIKEIENKISKLGFETNIRFVYVDKKDSFTRANVAAVLGALRQFNTQNLNAFKINGQTATKAGWPFKARKEYLRKRAIFAAYKARKFPSSGAGSVLNTEELATVYHYPLMVTEAPMLRRLESKKGEPPVNLPIIE